LNRHETLRVLKTLRVFGLVLENDLSYNILIIETIMA
jgi:hypothetical protein